MFYRVVNTNNIVTIVPLLLMGVVHVGDIRYLLRNKREFRRNLPVIQRLFHFLGSAILNLFKPWVEDHDILEYRKNLEAIAQARNLDLYMITHPEWTLDIKYR